MIRVHWVYGHWVLTTKGMDDVELVGRALTEKKRLFEN